MIYGKNIKEMLYFNMAGIICIPLLIGIINMPLYTSKIDLDDFKKIVDMDGIIKAFLNSEYAYYAFFQMVGMILLAFFMLHIVCSDFYISGIHNPNHCNQFLCLIGDIENNIIINRHNSCISTLPGLSFILPELLRILSQGKDFFFDPVKLSGCILRRKKIKCYILKDTAKIVLSLLRKGNIIFHTL